jgi:hypothetical protein
MRIIGSSASSALAFQLQAVQQLETLGLDLWVQARCLALSSPAKRFSPASSQRVIMGCRVRMRVVDEVLRCNDPEDEPVVVS